LFSRIQDLGVVFVLARDFNAIDNNFNAREGRPEQPDDLSTATVQ
jgi:hypothetical protein